MRLVKPFFATLCLLTALHVTAAQDSAMQQPDTVFNAQKLWVGTEHFPHHTYRIPTLAVLADGTVLAFAERRCAHAGDHGNIDTVVRRLPPGASTWSAESVVLDFGEKTIGNACPIVDPETHTITLVAVSNTVPEAQTEPGYGEKSRLVYVTRSTDSGQTWSTPDSISFQVKAPTWSWFATGPGAGIVLQHGAHKGRYVLGVNHRETRPDGPPGYYAHVIYSDDRGQHWKSSRTYAACGTNECEVLERVDGTLLLNMRNHGAPKYERATTVSTDGGESFSATQWQNELIEPQCMGALKRYDARTVLFLNPASRTRRENLTLRFSFDDGRTFPKSVVIEPGMAAYSHMAVRPDGALIIVYEADHYRAIRYLILPPEWMQKQIKTP